MVMEASAPGSLVRSCHPMVLPRALPAGAMSSLTGYGALLRHLEVSAVIRGWRKVRVLI